MSNNQGIKRRNNNKESGESESTQDNKMLEYSRNANKDCIVVSGSFCRWRFSLPDFAVRADMLTEPNIFRVLSSCLSQSNGFCL